MQSLKLASYPLYRGIIKDVKRTHTSINDRTAKLPRVWVLGPKEKKKNFKTSVLLQL